MERAARFFTREKSSNFIFGFLEKWDNNFVNGFYSKICSVQSINCFAFTHAQPRGIT